MTEFKSGFAVLAGLPNAGKSTMLNTLAGGLLSAITHKPQTTRQNILALAEGDNYQIIFVDTPGFLDAKYKLQQTMLNSFNQAVNEDADVVIFVYDPAQTYRDHAAIIKKYKGSHAPFFL
ncbi:small GTP-binding protein [Elusimicrobium posterum]|uniref:GTPase n=1 Tax=Elusimicrobium posterum TaxID=3116653 RepID=UPI003C70FCA0